MIEQIGSYRILDKLGEGGMGEVYRATDTALGRPVAIKVLPDAFASDPERLARFEREARTLASLNHPNIAQIYGLERGAPAAESGQAVVRALVMELVEGPTLADRIAHGPVPVDEALAIATEIAEALGAAHEQGIVHRDLKPANVKVRDDGTVKVLDFGLAKIVEPVAAVSSSQSLSPTITTPLMTQAGVLLGTAAYMSPEQAKGRPADKRSDVWAFGCLLYEMLTAKRAFEGEDVSDTIAAVLRGEPDWSALPPELPAPVRRLLRRCLQRDRRERLGDAAVLLFVLREPRTAPPDHSSEAASNAQAGTGARRRWTAAAITAAAGLAFGSYLAWPVRSSEPPERYHFTIPEPSNDTTFAAVPGAGTGAAPQVQLSPDGRSLVFVGHRHGEYQLWLRRLDNAAARPIAGTVGGAFPFWSPDSRQVAFFAGGKLRRVNIDGGPAWDIADAPAGRGGTWNRDDVIVFAPSAAGGLRAIPSSGGTPVDVTMLDTQYGETSHRFPVFLPDGRHFLYAGVVGTCCPATKPARLRTGRVDGADATVVGHVESWAAYHDGHLLYHHLGTLLARPFDVTSRTFSGEPFPVAEGLASEGSRYASFTASETGVLVYVLGDVQQQPRLSWFDRSGQRLGVVGSVGSSSTLALSPDERRVAVSLSRGLPPNADIYLIDLATGREDRFTFDSGPDRAPIWSPDGKQLFFTSTRPATTGNASSAGVSVLMQKPVDASRPEELLLEATDGLGTIVPLAWSPDARHLLLNRTLGTRGSRDLWVLPAFGDRKPRPFVQTAAEDLDAAFSADGRHVAYQSAESGPYQVYVEAFPDGGGRRQISRDGGSNPYWRADGRELFYVDLAGRLMVVETDTRDGFRHSAPMPLFTPRLRPGADGRQFVVTRDGQRILVNEVEEQSVESQVNVLVNWRARTRD